ncbi:GAF domain-containing sensor histidine kinase [Sediminibacterium roseum]|uniref:histidine kinase n=1 Tax=Sediminibacterium roseum TaxID=1978412 RepID=A0ABW9ZXE9_9BACT|nr:GAF domain-containing sensor histidine kinase [Sediminibacterium roseum]NCI49536.1 GAF domain-containing sensor histidine kinase [Sediminibacterium roseum]
MNANPPVHSNEMDRLRSLSVLDLDYSDAQESLKGLTMLAARIAGTSISLINLIDAFTQWNVSSYGLSIGPLLRGDSVCQYTILSEENFEVKDLSTDERFRDKSYVADEPKLKYYFGVPIQTSNGFNIGALCVMDKVGKEISPEKVELLKLIAHEVVKRLAAFQMVQRLKLELKESKEKQRRVAHDIRGPLGGIISLSQIITSQGENNKISDVLTFVNMIQKSGTSLLDLASEILSMPKTNEVAENIFIEEFNLSAFKEKIEKLYIPQALSKNITLTVQVQEGNETIPVAKSRLLQIAGNLISNAIKFTRHNGTVEVTLSLVPADKGNLVIRVKDTGRGMDHQMVSQVMEGKGSSNNGTDGEQGFGFGLALVQHLVKELAGTLQLQSAAGEGTVFEVIIPQ